MPRYTREQRDELIRAVTKGREPVSEAADRLGIPAATAYRWTRPTGERQPTFVELMPEIREPSLFVEVGPVRIEVRAGFDAALLRAVIAALQGVDA